MTPRKIISIILITLGTAAVAAGFLGLTPASATHGGGKYTCVNGVVKTKFTVLGSSVTPENDSITYHDGLDKNAPVMQTLNRNADGTMPDFVFYRDGAVTSTTIYYVATRTRGLVTLNVTNDVPACVSQETTTTKPTGSSSTTASSVPTGDTTTTVPTGCTANCDTTTTSGSLPPTGFNTDSSPLGPIGLFALGAGVILVITARRRATA